MKIREFITILTAGFVFGLFSFYIFNGKSENVKPQKKEPLVMQVDGSGNNVITHEVIHVINGFGLHMTKESYRGAVQNNGDSVSVYGIDFRLIPQFNQDSLLSSLALVSNVELGSIAYDEFVNHMKSVFELSYPGTFFGTTQNNLNNLRGYFNNEYRIDNVVKIVKQDKMCVAVGYVYPEAYKKDALASMHYFPKLTKRPVILFAEKESVEKSKSQRDRDRQIKDAVKFIEP